jgi:uncharacterized protein
MLKSTIPIPANCFNPKSYVKSHPASGLLSTRHGDRLIAIPELLLRSIPRILKVEAGEASYLALYTFGENWGRSLCDRVLQDLDTFYRQPIVDTIAAEFFVNMQSAWAVHGLGQPSIDFRLASKGLLIVTINNSGISDLATIDENTTYRAFSLEAGFVAGWFSNLTDRHLRTCAVNWQDPQSSLQFLVGGISQIEAIETTTLKQGQLDPEMLDSLS